MAASLRIRPLGVFTRLIDILRLHLFGLKFLKGDLVDLLQRSEDVHGVLVLASLSELRSSCHLSDHILVVIQNCDKKGFHGQLWSRGGVLLLVENDPELQRVLLANVAGHLGLIELLLHVDRAHGIALRSQYLLLTGGVVAHELVVHYAGLHVEELTVEVRRAANWLHMRRGLALRVLGGALELGHLPVVLEHVVRVDDRVHLTWHANDRAGHLRSHLTALGSSLRHLALRKSIHMRWHVHHRLRTDFVVAVSKRAPVLIWTLATTLIVFANVALVVRWINTELLLAHRTAHLGTLGHRLAHLREHGRALEAGLWLTHVHTLRTTKATTALLEAIAAKVIITFVAATEVWLLALLLESASARAATTHAAALVAS